MKKVLIVGCGHIGVHLHATEISIHLVENKKEEKVINELAFPEPTIIRNYRNPDVLKSAEPYQYGYESLHKSKRERRRREKRKNGI